MGGATFLFLYIINVMECDITTSVFSHIGIVSMLPAEDIAPCIMFQGFVCEERYFEVKISGIIYCTLLPSFFGAVHW